MTKTILNATACFFLLGTAALAQTNETKEAISEEEMTAADEAAGVMFVEIYGDAAPTYMTTSEAIDRMAAMGYTNVHDLDVEWGRYEVEAYAADGNEVEIEFDPVSGAILDVSDNWW